MTVVLFGVIIAVTGVEVIPYLILQAIVGFSLLEVVNYMEHYGMLRRRRAPAATRQVLPSHSWNSNNIGTNILLYPCGGTATTTPTPPVATRRCATTRNRPPRPPATRA